MALLAVAFALSTFLFSGGAAYADAYYGDFMFETDDGNWDGYLFTTSADRDVAIDYGGLFFYSHSTGQYVRPVSDNEVYVRLCNASTGACTSQKPMNGTTVYFTDMKADQKYYIDVRDVYSSYYVFGSLGATVY
jgi:hypothetical protein